MEMRTSNTEKVNNFIASLPPNLSEKKKNSRKLQFMAENGIRQLGLPRIGHFADKLGRGVWTGILGFKSKRTF